MQLTIDCLKNRRVSVRLQTPRIDTTAPFVSGDHTTPLVQFGSCINYIAH